MCSFCLGNRLIINDKYLRKTQIMHLHLISDSAVFSWGKSAQSRGLSVLMSSFAAVTLCLLLFKETVVFQHHLKVYEGYIFRSVTGMS